MSPVYVLDVSGTFPLRGEKGSRWEVFASAINRAPFAPAIAGEKVPKADEGGATAVRYCRLTTTWNRDQSTRATAGTA